MTVFMLVSVEVGMYVYVGKKEVTLSYLHYIHTYLITDQHAPASVMKVPLVKVRRARTNTHTHTVNTYLRKLESWDQYGGMCVLGECN